MSDPVSVAGLQPERTALAWQRVALALAGLGVAAARVGWPALGGWAVLPAALVVALASVVFGTAHCRYRRARAAVREGQPAALPDGRLPLVAAATVLGLGLTALAVVLLGRTG
jgi:putative membrane protein